MPPDGELCAVHKPPLRLKKARVTARRQKQIERRQERIEDLIHKLGADDFQLRDAATKRLKKIGLLALALLQKAAQNGGRSPSTGEPDAHRAHSAGVLAEGIVNALVEKVDIEYDFDVCSDYFDIKVRFAERYVLSAVGPDIRLAGVIPETVSGANPFVAKLRSHSIGRRVLEVRMDFRTSLPLQGNLGAPSDLKADLHGTFPCLIEDAYTGRVFKITLPVTQFGVQVTPP